MINFLPYGRQYIDDNDIDEVVKVLKSDFLTTGPNIKRFEEKICEITDSKYSVAVSNGTAALHLSSLVLLKKGDKVLTTPNSFLATANSILYADCVPVFVDIKKDGNIDLDLCEQKIKEDKKIKALFVVHFSGNPVDQEKLKYIKEKYNIKILEDCAHSIGAKFKMKSGEIIKSGSCKYSDLSILSFHPVKHITCGEGGAITTNSKELYEKLLILRTHGMQKENFKNEKMAFDASGNVNPWYYEMQNLGFNYRITDFQCALGWSQLNKLERFVKRRREIAKIYDDGFKNTAVRPLYKYNDNSSYHLYVVKIDYTKHGMTRAGFIKLLKEKNIGTQVHYIPINKQPYYKKLGYGTEATPVMDNYYDECISIPMYPSLSNEEIYYIMEQMITGLKR